MGINQYWDNKEKRALQARLHTLKMAEKYSDYIHASINNTKLYDTDFVCGKLVVEKETMFCVESIDSVSAIFNHCTGDSKIAVLNFASYKHPGGMFFNGSKAQEECLCHESFLYNVLTQKVSEFYDWNNKHKNKALYLNRGLYSPDIIFEHAERTCSCDVITCAAPNKSAAQKYQNVSDEENTQALRSRIKFVLDIAKDNNVDTLILGAYGCGVFGQDAAEVANIFKEYLTTTHKCFDKVVFAIPNGRDGNLGKFQYILGEK